MPTVIVLGTGTGVGKTYTTCCIASALVGHMTSQVVALKPIESGLTDVEHSDAALLGACSRPRRAPSHVYALADPVSPHLAARNQGIEISTDRVTSWVRNQAITEGVDSWVVVETAGGAFTPLTQTATNVTLATQLEPAVWVLVAPDRLGVLHELSSTLLALEAVARKPDLVILNAPEFADASTGTNRAEIHKLGIANVMCRLERNAAFNEEDLAGILNYLKARSKAR